MFNSSFRRVRTRFSKSSTMMNSSTRTVLYSLKSRSGFINEMVQRFVSGSAHLQVMDFQKMPSPRGLPFVGTAFSLIMAGGYTRLHEYVDKRHKELGPIFKDNVGPVTAVFLSNAEEMRKVFAKESKFHFYILLSEIESVLNRQTLR